MSTVFRHALRRFRGQVLSWGMALALLGWMIVSVYDTIAAQQENIIKLISNYPRELMAFFGAGNRPLDLFTPEAFLSFEFLSLAPVILGIFAVLTGSGLLVGDEEKGTLDLLLAHPISRSALFLGRLLASVVATLGILAIIWLGFMVAMSWSTLRVGELDLWGPLLSLLAVLLFFVTLSLLLSMVLPSRRLAASVAGLFLVASYFVTSLSSINDNLETAARFSPLSYYQTEEAFHNLNAHWLVGLLLVAALFAALAWWQFQRRDIRVGGEAGWRVPALALPRR